MSDLPNGHYLICASGDKGHLIGRRAADSEDANDAAKRVVALPNIPDAEPPTWAIERLPNGRYKLTASDAPTGIRGGLLWAYADAAEDADSVLSDSGWDTDSNVSSSSSSINNNNIEEWELRPYRAAGKSFYTIEWAEGGAGWVSQSKEPYTQIAVAPLSGQGKPEELWTVLPLPSEN